MSGKSQLDTPMSEPPEAVLAGESVPLENQQEELEEKRIRDMVAVLKSRGEPYSGMNDYELRERAIDALDKYTDWRQ